MDNLPRVSAAGIWYRIPLALRVLVLVAAWFSYGVLLSNFNYLDDSTRTAVIIWGTCQAGTWVTIASDAAVRGSFTSLDDLISYSTALRTGELPDEVDARQWRRRVRRSRMAVVLTPVFFYPVIAFGVMSADSSHSPYRVPLEGILVSCGIWLFVTLCIRGVRVTRLESEINRRLSAVPRASSAAVQTDWQRTQDQLRANAELPLAQRFVAGTVCSGVVGFVVLLVADLDSVVYGGSRITHVGWAALGGILLGLITVVAASGDPRLSATSHTIDSILQYDKAFHTGELPAQFDFEQWRRWTRSHRRSSGVVLVWACVSFAVAGWSLLGQPPGYHWIVAVLLAVIGGWGIYRWRLLCARIALLRAQVDRYAVRQLFG